MRRRLPEMLEDAENELSALFRDLLAWLGEHLKALDEHVDALEHEIKQWHRENAVNRRLEQIFSSELIIATALVASVGDARHFQNGRQLAAWLGLVPKLHASGGKQRLLGISKRGDGYSRTLLIHGARSIIRFASAQSDTNPWFTRPALLYKLG